MNFIKIIDFITFYGVDVAVLGILTSVLTQILKTTVLKNAPNKLYAFLPVIIGVLLYAVYALATKSFYDFGTILEKGFSVGAAATVIYVIFEQFTRGNVRLPSAEKVVEAMIADCIDAEMLSSVAKKIEDEFDCSDLQSSTERIAEVLLESSQGEADEQGFTALAMLIAQTLARIKKVTP